MAQDELVSLSDLANESNYSKGAFAAEIQGLQVAVKKETSDTRIQFWTLLQQLSTSMRSLPIRIKIDKNQRLLLAIKIRDLQLKF